MMSFLTGIKLTKINPTSASRSGIYTDSAREGNRFSLLKSSNPALPSAELHCKKTFICGIPSATTQQLLRAGPKLFADSCVAGFPLPLDTDTESTRWGTQLLSSKLTALPRLSLINVLWLLTLNVEELEGTRVSCLALLLNTAAHYGKYWDVLFRNTRVCLTIPVGVATEVHRYLHVFYMCTYTSPHRPAVLTHIILAIILRLGNVISLLLSLPSLHSEAEKSSTKNIYSTLNLHCTAQAQGSAVQIFSHTSNLRL